MKKTFIHTLTAVLLSSIGISSTGEALEIPHEQISNISLPDSFTFKELYKENNTFIFREDNAFFAQGSFKKKFTLKTPYGKTISTARIYEAIPNNAPLLVVRGDDGKVLGFVQLENYHRTQIFKKLTGIIYNRNGTQILKIEYPLASKHFNVFAVETSLTKPIASTKSGNENDFHATFHANYADLNIDPIFLLSIFHIHASKTLLASLADHSAIDEIDVNELGAYTQHTDGENFVKSVAEKGELLLKGYEVNRWQALKELLTATSHPMSMEEFEKEEIANALAQRFKANEEVSVSTLEEEVNTLTNEEKVVLAEMIENRLTH